MGKKPNVTLIVSNGQPTQFYVAAELTSVAELLASHSGNSPDKAVQGFFSFGAANPNQESHVRRLGQNLWGFEDLPGGGDRDYNDAVLEVTFASL